MELKPDYNRALALAQEAIRSHPNGRGHDVQREITYPLDQAFLRMARAAGVPPERIHEGPHPSTDWDPGTPAQHTLNLLAARELVLVAQNSVRHHETARGICDYAVGRIQTDLCAQQPFRDNPGLALRVSPAGREPERQPLSLVEMPVIVREREEERALDRER